MFRRIVPLLTSVTILVALAPASAAAKVFTVTGQQTQITPSAQTVQFLASHNVTVTPLAPATEANGSLSLPITGGFVRSPSLRGRLHHAGGVEFSSGQRTLVLSRFVLRSRAHRTLLSALVRGRRLVLAQVANVTKTVNGKSGTISGELLLSGRAARRIDRWFGQHLLARGADIGSLSSTVTVA